MKPKLLVSLIALALCMSVVLWPAGGASGATVKTESTGQATSLATASQTSSLTTAKFDFTTAGIGSFVLDKAGGALATQAFNFVFSQIGLNAILHPDPTLAVLENLQTQLDGISKQLTTVQTSLDSLTADVRTGQLTDALRALDSKTTELHDLYRRKFLPVDAAGTAYKKALESGDASKIKNAFDALILARDDFYISYDSGTYGAMPEFIHKFLVPGAAISVLAAKGKVLLSEHRYLTRADSLQIRELYDALADEEALASWMLIERDTPTIDPPPPYPHSSGSATLVEQDRQIFLDYRIAEAKNLPPVIPAGVVVDAGQLSGNNTNNVTMWLPVKAGLRFEPGIAGGGTVPAALAGVNARYAEGFNNWQVPSQASLTLLLGGFTPQPSTTPDSFLSGLNATPDWQQIDADAWPFLWSNDVVTQPLNCMVSVGSNLNNFNYPVVTHTGVSTSTPTAVWAGHPKIPREVPNINVVPTSPDSLSLCANFPPYVFATATDARGGLLAARSTGAMPMDYMAQGAGPNLRPNANLRNANLAGLDLAGVDLSSADLTGATLTKAFFSDDVGTRSVNLTGAQLSGVTSGGIEGSATLPSPWKLVNGYLVGPGAHLTGANLSGANLSTADLTGVRSGGVNCAGCTLPSGWRWTGLPSGYLVGPGANLAGADLQGLDLNRVNLSNADLSGALLSGANFLFANFTGAKLNGANLTGANLGGTNLSGANLADADLTSALLGNANLTSADLSRANATGANFTVANLSLANLADADFSQANMTDALLSGATILGTNFTGATFTRLRSGIGIFGTPAALPTGWRVYSGFLMGPGANLLGLNLPGANLANFDLAGANIAATTLSNANLSGANLVGTNISNANLSGANLTGANLTGADFGNTNLTNAILTNATMIRASFIVTTITNATFTTNDDNKFAGIVSSGLIGTPKALPASGRFRVVQGYLVGPNTNLAGATFTSTAQLGPSLSGTNFTGATLTGVNLTGATLRNTILTNARLTGATIGGADMTNATLDGVISGSVVGGPFLGLPPGWRLIDGYLLGPRANLSGASLSGANLTGLDLSGADLSGANLSGVNFTGANLNGAELAGAVLTNATWSSTTCPNGVQQSSPCAPVAWLGTSTVSVSVNNIDGTLSIDVGPDLGGATWTVIVQQLTESGGWKAFSTHTTKGPGDTLKLNLANGTYRALVPAQNSYHGSVSAAAVLAK